jgi:hypothetical protein
MMNVLITLCPDQELSAFNRMLKNVMRRLGCMAQASEKVRRGSTLNF